MTGDARLFVGSGHCQLRVVAAAPLLRGIEIDLFWTTEPVHRVVHLHAFPAMIVVVFVKYEIHRGPPGGEETIEALLVRHVDQLVDLPPVVPLKTLIELRITFQRRILVNVLSIRNTWTTRTTQRHVVISFVAFG